MQKSRTNESNSNILTALREAKHDVDVITVLLIKTELDNYKKKVGKRKTFIKMCMHSGLIYRDPG